MLVLLNLVSANGSPVYKGQEAGKMLELLHLKVHLKPFPLGKFEISRDPDSKQVHVLSSMVTATLSCKEESVEVEAQLSLLATPFRSKLDEGITRWISKTFNI
jgi:hypothetical protein